MSRAVRYFFMVAYCIAILLALDFAYSSLFYNDDKRPLHIRSPIYHHALAANFDGFDVWGELRHKIYTNDFGLKDATVRHVALKPQGRRILLIGDSFTEGVGLAFEDTFAGMLYRAGQAREDKIEFLNAGVGSYSPTIYYAKVKNLLDRGLQFDEVVVFVDMSDIRDEAVHYFCVDQIPEYRVHCRDGVNDPENKTGLGWWLQKKFIVIDTLRVLIKYKWRMWFRGAAFELAYSRLDGWGVPGWNPEKNDFVPLGIEGGITRAKRHMQQLTDLLKKRSIPLSVVVYPYAALLNHNDRDSRQIQIWRSFCSTNCKRFINIFPAFFSAKEAHSSEWYRRYFIFGDIHYNVEGNRIMFNELAKHLL